MSDAMRVGIDLVQVSRIAESVELFGDRFVNRVFTDHEIAYARQAPPQAAERLAARFAAKEATFKALRLGNHPMTWRDIEVQRAPDGFCEVALHGDMRVVAEARGVRELSVCLSHEGDYAVAIVLASLTQDDQNE